VASRTTFQLLGPTEHAILDILWRDGPSTIPHIIETIRRTRPPAHGPGRAIAYNTVKTIVERMTDKGFVTRERTGQWAHTYTAAPRAVLLAAAFERQLTELGATEADRASILEALRG
jgi:predicted transcriptional regulator